MKVIISSEYEIIYVDSNSKDNSLEIANKNDVSKIILLTKLYNAAIARNIGAVYSKGDILVFLDGDMELYEDFLKHVIIDHELSYPLVSGRVHQVYLNSEGNILEEEILNAHISSIFRKPITGGAFIINRRLFFSVDGFDNRFKRGEDPELGLRLTKKGNLLTYLPKPFVKHNTKFPNKFDLKELVKGYHLYSNFLIYKKNITSKYTYKRIWSHDKTLVILLLSFFLSILISAKFFFVYILALLFRANIKKPDMFLRRFLYYLCRDVSILLLSPFFKKGNIETSNINFTIIK